MACCPTEDKIYGYDNSRFEKDVDENFHCSICYNVLKEARMCKNNEHIFCLDCISCLASNYLSKINCDHAGRGCPELTCPEDLETHVANCGFAPVLCSNAECGMVINKQERVHHETAVCQYRKVKCHDCGQIQEVVGRLEGRLMELDGKVEATNKEMKNNQVEVKKIVGTLKVEAVKNSQDRIQQEVKKEVKDVKKIFQK